MFYTDGESIILESGLSPEVMDKFVEESVGYLKGPPSGTGSHQACDRASTFKCLKSDLKEKIDHNNTDLVKGPLTAAITKAFRDYDAKYPSQPLTGPFKQKLKTGLLNLVYLMKNKRLSQEEVRKGFLLCGQHMYEKDFTEAAATSPLDYSTVNYQLVMNQCFTRIPLEEEMKMRNNLLHFMNVARANGKITDDDLDAKEIMKLPDHLHICRDSFVIWRSHAILLSHGDTRASFADYLQQRFNKNDVDYLAAQKEEEQRLKRIHAFEVEQAKEDEKKRKAEEKKEAKERLQNMSKDEKKAEQDRKKVEAQAKKVLKQQKEDEKAQAKEQRRQQYLVDTGAAVPAVPAVPVVAAAEAMEE
jgi:hypothetical protein